MIINWRLGQGLFVHPLIALQLLDLVAELIKNNNNNDNNDLKLQPRA